MKNNSSHFNFTEKALESLPIPEKVATYYDSGSTDGLCVIITYGGTKTYYAYMKFHGMPKRVKIGRVGKIKLVAARAMAKDLKTKAEHDEDPALERQDKLKDMTLKQFYETQYVPRHSAAFKKQNSQRNERSVFYNNLGPFHNRKMISVSTDEIRRLHQKIREEKSPVTANRALALISHLYTKALEWGYPARHGNPAIGVKLFKEKSRERFIQDHEFERFFTALKDEPHQLFKNYVLLSLFIGQRKSNILAMRWKDIDFTNGVVYFADTKNGESQHIPITKQALALLRGMKKGAKEEWVFPSEKSASGHFEEPKKLWNAFLERAGIEDLRLHDLRRTLATRMAVNNASPLILQKAMGHKTMKASLVYARMTTDPVRNEMQKATDKMLEYRKTK